MAALGLTRGQVGIAATVYSGLMASPFPKRSKNRIVHVVANSTVHPTKELGGGPLNLEVKVRTNSAGIIALLTAVENPAQKKLSFLIGEGAGQEVYYLVGAGECAADQDYPTSATYTFDATLTFVAGDQRLYKASDDSVLLGA